MLPTPFAKPAVSMMRSASALSFSAFSRMKCARWSPPDSSSPSTVNFTLSGRPFAPCVQDSIAQTIASVGPLGEDERVRVAPLDHVRAKARLLHPRGEPRGRALHVGGVRGLRRDRGDLEELE